MPVVWLNKGARAICASSNDFEVFGVSFVAASHHISHYPFTQTYNCDVWGGGTGAHFRKYVSGATCSSLTVFICTKN